MKLHKIHNDLKGKLWCGIAALSAITGNSAQHSKDCIRLAIDDMLKRTGRTIKGVYSDELLAALKYLMIDTQQVYYHKNFKDNLAEISVARFLLGYKPKPNNLYLMIIPNHFIVTDGNSISDSAYPNGVSCFHYPRIDEKLIMCWELSDTSLDNL